LREALLARRTYAVAQNYNHLLLNFTATHNGVSYPMGSRLSLPDNDVRFHVNVSQRAGKQTPLQAQNTVIDVISSVRNNQAGYAPVISAEGNKNNFNLSNETRQQWVFVRVRDKATGQIVAVSAPIWFKRASSPLPSCNNGR
jgi:hypothetical protein